MLTLRGIESCEEWHEYINTMERDGEALAGICDMLNTDVLQVKRNVASPKRETGRKDEATEVQGAFDWTNICRSLGTTFNIDGFDNTYAGRSRLVVRSSRSILAALPTTYNEGAGA
uniref:Transposase n=1 Tax=Haemonchus contortus TaxID=6289 RepID=A0A7I4YYJ7_HAECO